MGHLLSIWKKPKSILVHQFRKGRSRIVSNANLGSSKMIQGQQTLDKFLVFKSDSPSGTASNPNNSLQSLESETGGKFR
jgi:hypothetical protein